MNASFIYGGTSKYLGRFGFVNTGDTLELTEPEQLAVAADPLFFQLPTARAAEFAITADATLDAADSGKVIVLNHSDVIELTLPAAPTAGVRFDLQFGTGDDDVTIEPGDKEIIGVTDTKKISAIAVTNPGSAYTAIPTISFSGGGSGTGATAVARMLCLTAPVAAAGTGYGVGDTIQLAGGTFTTRAVATVASVKVVAGAVSAGGTGYSNADVLTLVGGTFTVAATLTVSSNAAGVITGVTVSNAGNYTVKPTGPVAVTGGGGTAATFTLTWGVSTTTVSTAGNYSVLPSNPVAQFATSGSGTSATFTVTWGVLSVTVTAGGEGFSSAPTVIFSSGAAAGTATVVASPGDLVLAAADERLGIFYNGEAWATY